MRGKIGILHPSLPFPFPSIFFPPKILQEYTIYMQKQGMFKRANTANFMNQEMNPPHFCDRMRWTVVKTSWMDLNPSRRFRAYQNVGVSNCKIYFSVCFFLLIYLSIIVSLFINSLAILGKWMWFFPMDRSSHVC